MLFDIISLDAIAILMFNQNRFEIKLSFERKQAKTNVDVQPDFTIKAVKKLLGSRFKWYG